MTTKSLRKKLYVCVCVCIYNIYLNKRELEKSDLESDLR